MNSVQLIRELQNSNLYAECTCGDEFKLSDSIMFDGTGSFPSEAEGIKKELLSEIKERLEELKKRKLYADVGAEKKAMVVGIGKIIEKILPAHKEFPLITSDCRPLFEPVDMIVFNGCTNSKVDSITFLEIKTGKAKLNSHQKAVRDAIEERKLDFKMI